MLVSLLLWTIAIGSFAVGAFVRWDTLPSLNVGLLGLAAAFAYLAVRYGRAMRAFVGVCRE